MAEGLDRSCDPRHGGRQARRDGVEAEERTGPGLESCVPHCRTTPRRCRRLRLRTGSQRFRRSDSLDRSEGVRPGVHRRSAEAGRCGKQEVPRGTGRTGRTPGPETEALDARTRRMPALGQGRGTRAGWSDGHDWQLGEVWLLKTTERRFTMTIVTVSYTHLRAHETDSYLVCRLLLETK